MSKVSVIIPVYNGEAYLRQCLDSVCAQTLEEMEIICVDDGSTDSSWQILEEYREKDPRFRLFRQQNQHVSAARNNGLAQAEGKYVIFWDCDDFFEPNALELLYQRAEETGAEICVCNNDLYYQKDGKRYPEGFSLNLKRIPEEEDTFNRFTNPEHILSFTNTAAWNKLFLRSFLTANDVAFPPDFHYAEDTVFSFAALCSASKITTVNEVLIHYRWINPESLTGESLQRPLESMLAHEFAVDQLIQRDIVPRECLGRKMLSLVRRDLQYAGTKVDFFQMLQYLREGNNGVSLLEKFDIVEREKGYYYGANDDEYVRCLLHDEPGDVLAFFMHDSWQKQRVSSADRRRLRAELKTAKADRKAAREELKKVKAERKADKEKLKEVKEERKALKEERKALKEELKAVKAELKTTRKTLNNLQNSRSYRLGRMLLFLPCKLRNLFRRVARISHL